MTVFLAGKQPLQITTQIRPPIRLSLSTYVKLVLHTENSDDVPVIEGESEYF